MPSSSESTDVSFHRLAERELNEATQYYERERPGLGSAFLNEVQRCSRSIAEHPGAGRVIVGQVRRRLLRRFPYGILYAHKADGLRILAVMNLKRRPAYWVGRE